MPSPAALNLFAIPADRPFLDSLAAGVATRVGAAPDALSRVTLLLPTRRAARALREAFVRLSGGRAMLLPRMRALAGLSTEDADELDLPALLDLPPAVEPLTRQAVLAAMVAKLPPRHGGPRSPEQAWSLAGEMARLLDEIALEEKDPALLRRGEEDAFVAAWLDRFAKLAPEEHAKHWEITTTFLRAVVQDWTGWLADHGLLDIGVRRVLALTEQAKAWQEDPPAHPVIAAGIGAGGTIPAAAALLRQLCRMQHGAVVVQGACDLEDGLWRAIGDAATHPFCGLGRLLAQLDASYDDVRAWDGAVPPIAPAARAMLLARALRPAEGLQCWTMRDRERWNGARAGMSRLRAADAQQEAVATALLLRGALETPGARAALVTPDRTLARRVAAELARHGITADDSAGEPLAMAPAAAFLRLIGAALAQDFSPSSLLALAKHPLCAGGMERIAWLAAVRRLERLSLRGARPAPGLAGLRAAAKRDDDAIAALLDTLDRCFAPLATLDGAARPVTDLLAAQMRIAEALASTPGLDGGLRLYAGEEGEPLARHLHALAEALTEHPPIAPRAWPDFFEACLAGPVAPSLRSVRRGGEPHPRVEILGLLEARLLSFDTVVLGALEETVWPLATDPGPWMSRPMRKQFGLPEPEARIGRVAADFLYVACAAPNTVLSAAQRRDGSPCVPARWLVRLETFLRGQGELALHRSPASDWAAALDMPDGAAKPCARPAPRPPAALRPRTISVSGTRTLIADPYAFYARTMLRLRPLDPLDQDVGAIEYGNLVHAALHGFLSVLGAGWPGAAAAIAAWERAAEAALSEYESRPAIVAFWGPRLGHIGRFVVEQEEELRKHGRLLACMTEQQGQATLRVGDGEIVVLARADRIDRLADGGWRVVDYKTGSTPSDRDLATGAAPQLPMEALILERGGFPGAPAGSRTTGMIYWRLTGGEVPGEVRARLIAEKDTGIPLADLAADRLAALAERYLLGDAPFESRPHPGRGAPGGDYDHLARIAEWSIAEEEAS